MDEQGAARYFRKNSENKRGIKRPDVTLRNKNPDFININGDKSCIEVANRFHHQGDWAVKRKEHFKKLGWDCAIFFEDEIDENKIINDLWF
jgi:hypothetical protein